MSNANLVNNNTQIKLSLGEVGPQGIPGPRGVTGPTGPAAYMNVDGGSATSVYTQNQSIDGGTAGSF